MTTLTFECSICFENLSDEVSVSSTECGHLFHTACIRSWARPGRRRPNPTCPLCIQPMSATRSAPRFVKVYLPKTQKRSSLSLEAISSGLEGAFPNNELVHSALESRKPISSNLQLTAVHKKLDNDYNRLRAVHETRITDITILDGINLSLVDERERLKREMEHKENIIERIKNCQTGNQNMEVETNGSSSLKVPRRE